MKTKEFETPSRFVRRLFGTAVCLGAVMLIGSTAPAQNLFVSVSDVVVGDVVGGRIFEFTPDGVQSTFASGLSNPQGLAFDNAGNLFVGDGDAIYKFTREGVRTTFALGLTSPYAVGCDNRGNLFVADSNGSILKFTPEGARTTFASGVSGFGAVAVDGSGNLFVAKTVDNRPPGQPVTATSFIVYKFTPDGRRSTFASGHFPTAFGSVSGLGVDQAGNLYLVDAGQFYDGGGCTIYKFTPGGNRSIFFGPTPTFTQEFFGALAIDSVGNVFVTDDAGGILKITQDGNQTFFASVIGADYYVGPLAFQPAQTAPTPTPTPAPTPTPTPTPTATPAIPAVSLKASPASVNKGGTATFTATVSMSDPFDAMVVNFSTGGNAVNGTDYTLSANQIIIPAGQFSGSVTLQVTTAKPKGREKAIMTLQPGSGYTVLTKNKANVAKVIIHNK